MVSVPPNWQRFAFGSILSQPKRGPVKTQHPCLSTYACAVFIHLEQRRRPSFLLKAQTWQWLHARNAQISAAQKGFRYSKHSKGMSHSPFCWYPSKGYDPGCRNICNAWLRNKAHGLLCPLVSMGGAGGQENPHAGKYCFQ